ncbi:MAG: GNAT family N-acetyltransferase [Chitinophagaceae bacterium]|nr:MAG: GNAT family N-acetyltransferase [Chitinophagaceae bacterium]
MNIPAPIPAPAGNVSLVAYEPQYKAAFRNLNEEWISRYFRMEPADYEALDHPEEKILAKGGAIVVALLDGVPVGVCALLHHAGEWELAKMAVAPAAQGRRIGFLLGQRIIDLAREKGASVLFLESNTVLEPAIRLYHKLGFVEVPKKPSPYERSNIRMERTL